MSDRNVILASLSGNINSSTIYVLDAGSNVAATAPSMVDDVLTRASNCQLVDVAIGATLVVLLVVLVAAGITKSIASVHRRSELVVSVEQTSKSSATPDGVMYHWPTVDNPLLYKSPDSLYDVSELERSSRLVN